MRGFWFSIYLSLKGVDVSRKHFILKHISISYMSEAWMDGWIHFHTTILEDFSIAC